MLKMNIVSKILSTQVQNSPYLWFWWVRKLQTKMYPWSVPFISTGEVGDIAFLRTLPPTFWVRQANRTPLCCYIQYLVLKING